VNDTPLIVAVGLGSNLERFEGAKRGVRLRRTERGVARVVTQLLVGEVDHIGRHLLQKVLVVRHEQDGGALEPAEVVDEPFDGVDVQMVGGLVQHEEGGILQHGACNSQLHAPSTRQLVHHATGDLIG